MGSIAPEAVAAGRELTTAAVTTPDRDALRSFGRDPRVDEADDLLNKLHFLVGQAKATGTAGGVTVFRAEPGRPQLPAAQ